MTAEDRAAALTASVAAVAGSRSVRVACSGGVDSAVVLAAAARAVGPGRTTAVTARSPAVPPEEVAAAAATAAAVGVPHVVVDTDEGSRAGYRRNAGDRCYFCKTALYETVAALADASGGAVLLNGTNADDLGDHRPGLRAAEEAGVRSPLAETGCTKRDVRAIASLWRLSVADKPAQPCLASRIAYGVEVTPERLRRVEEAERYLRRAFGLAVLRVRTEAGERARIEVPTGDIGAVRERFEAVSAELSRLGFAAVAIDPAGFRSGSLNDALPIVETAAVWTGPGQRTTAGTSNTR